MYTENRVAGVKPKSDNRNEPSFCLKTSVMLQVNMHCSGELQSLPTAFYTKASAR